MDNENSSLTQAQNESVNDNTQNDGTQTSEGGSEGNGTENGAKQEESPYAKQLKEMEEREKAALKEAEDAKAALEAEKEVNERKEKAIQKLKEKKNDVPDIDQLEERILSKVRAEKQAEEVRLKVSKITNDPTEQALILKIRDTRVVKTGNVEQELLDAVAIANSHVVIEQKRNKAQEEQREDFLTSFSTPSIRGQGGSVTTDPIQRAAEEMVRAINPRAVENVKKQFTN